MHWINLTFISSPLNMLNEWRHTCLELGGGVEFRLNGVQLHPKMFLIYLDCITTFSLNLLFDQHLQVKYERMRSEKYKDKHRSRQHRQLKMVPGNLFELLRNVEMVFISGHFIVSLLRARNLQPFILLDKVKKRWNMYLQHPVREIHQLPLVLGNLGHCSRLVLLEFTDVIGDNLQVRTNMPMGENSKHVKHFPLLVFISSIKLKTISL